MAISRYSTPVQGQYQPLDYDMLYKVKAKKQQDFMQAEEMIGNTNQFLAGMRAINPEDQAALDQRTSAYKQAVEKRMENFDGNYGRLVPFMTNLNRQLQEDMTGGDLAGITTRYKKGMEDLKYYNKRYSQGHMTDLDYYKAKQSLGQSGLIQESRDVLDEMSGWLNSSASEYKTLEDFQAAASQYVSSQYAMEIGRMKEFEKEAPGRIDNLSRGLEAAVFNAWQGSEEGRKDKFWGKITGKTENLGVQKTDSDQSFLDIKDSEFDNQGNFRQSRKDKILDKSAAAIGLTAIPNVPAMLSSGSKKADIDKVRPIVKGGSTLSDKEVTTAVNRAEKKWDDQVATADITEMSSAIKENVRSSMDQRTIISLENPGMDTDWETVSSELGWEGDLNKIHILGRSKKNSMGEEMIYGTVQDKKGKTHPILMSTNTNLNQGQNAFMQATAIMLDDEQRLSGGGEKTIGNNEKIVVKSEINPVSGVYEPIVDWMFKSGSEWAMRPGYANMSMAEFNSKVYGQ